MRLNLLRPERKPPAPKVHAFLAVHYDEEFLDEVAALVERLRGDPRLSQAKWVSPSHLRTTINFFLATSEAQRDALLAAPSEEPLQAQVKLAQVTPGVDVSHLGDAARSLRPGRLTAISLHATNPNQIGDGQNRYDVIASARFRAT